MNSVNDYHMHSDNENEKKIPDSVKAKSGISVGSVIRYWRNSLSDEQMMGISCKEMKKGRKVEFAQLKSGELPTNLFIDFFHSAEQKARGKQKKAAKFNTYEQYNKTDHKEYLVKTMDFYIAPYTARKWYEHGTRKGVNTPPIEVFPLWIVGTLSRDGTLSASEELMLPWIERKCLKPNENIKGGLGYPIIGDISTLDQFYTRNPLGITPEETEISWSKLFSYAQKLFKIFAKSPADSFRNQDFELLEHGYILPVDNLVNANKSLISLYDQYLTSHADRIPSVLKQLCSFKEGEYLGDLSNRELLLKNKTHLGQMHKVFPLSERQRMSLSYMSVKENNDIFTVNGPPGTGKTDMLSSIIASFWVESAINEKFPQLLVASSTNNTAVTNILTRLIVNDKCSVKHWVPDFDSFGMYLTANYKSAEAEKEGYVYRTRNGGGIGKKSIDSIYSLEYRHKATKYFLTNYNRHFSRNELSIKNAGESKLSDCIGIITPFKPQKELLDNLLKQSGLIIDKVGTVHALQGAEKPLIIFSPVYTTESKASNYFFDKSPNMLNVAVSRAKLSFIVFGDMGIFDVERADFPSSLLAKYLFSDSKNEIVDIIQPKYMSLLYHGDNIEQISTLEQHRAVLKDAFKMTEKELHIVSPFLTTNAIESDAITELIQQYISRISINIYSDPRLNYNWSTKYEESITMLKNAGANVYRVNRVHSKLIIIDNSVIIEGSFNWLSASRDRRYAREESSVLYRGERVSTFIKQAFDPIKAKIPGGVVKA